MHALLIPATDRRKTIEILAVTMQGLDRQLAELDARDAAWLRASGFAAIQGEVALVPDGEGRLARVLFGLGDAQQAPDCFIFGKLPTLLPAGDYALRGDFPEGQLVVLGWLLGSYRFERYRKRDGKVCRLKLPKGIDGEEVTRIADSVALARDLVNTPANDMGPEDLDAAARKLARTHRARISTITGEALLKKNLPLILAVGQASPRQPRLIDLTWGERKHPKVTLVGKGVCFDTGGLDLKPSSGMALMKKDMGGAANVLALANMIMGAELPVRLRVLIPAVENSVSGNAFRPGDVYPSRKGLSVEIGNTDAEGRLVLADALALGDEDRPDLMVDMATLTGAARVALGPDLPPFYTDDETLARDLARHSGEMHDPLWRMPLWRPYDRLLESKIADVNHISSTSFAGSVTAALFLRRFVERARSWVHLDIYAWTPSARPGRPEGGEAQGIRALYGLIKERYGK